MPHWGLIDIPPQGVAADRHRARRSLSFSWVLSFSSVILLLAAFAQLWVYILLIINRHRPVDTITAWSAIGFVWLFGVLSVAATTALLITMIRWLRDERVRRYARRGLRDPRPLWQLVAGTVIPVLNLVWPAVFIHELMAAADDPTPRRTRTRLRRWWLAWVLLSLLCYVTLLIRWSAESVQWQANAVLLAVICDVGGAAFAALSYWTLTHVIAVSDSRVPGTRWVLAG